MAEVNKVAVTLRNIQRSRDLTQGLMAAMIGVDRISLNKMMKGHSFPSPTTCLMLEREFPKVSALQWMTWAAEEKLARARRNWRSR